ncbi:hypothetical protein WJX74_001160 [Apatococcus lobatus]|uniref:Uncharacterized protein n=2 Tax=Apatococcus TaxID=904362 RepID=A0AAW1SYK6_9CHLO
MTCSAAGVIGSSLFRVAEGRAAARSLHSAARPPCCLRGRPCRSQVRRSTVAQAEPNVWPTNPGMSTMTDNSVVRTDRAPAPVGAYSQAIRAGGSLFVSGQLGLAPGESKLTTEDAADQAKQALDNLGQILTAAGSSLNQVVKTTVLLVDMADFKAVNEVYGPYFGEKPPARVCYAVKALPLNAKVEIDAIAVV